MNSLTRSSSDRIHRNSIDQLPIIKNPLTLLATLNLIISNILLSVILPAIPPIRVITWTNRNQTSLTLIWMLTAEVSS
jgi:hypothetical protein